MFPKWRRKINLFRICLQYVKRFQLLSGGTDSKHFLGITEHVLRFSPMYAATWQGRDVHGENKAAFVDAVVNAAKCYYELLRQL